MTHWERADVERCLDCRFCRLDTEPNFELLEARFSSRGLLFVLVVDAPHEWICLRSDPVNPDQATPAFEFTFRSDRIQVTADGCDYKSVIFNFADGRSELSSEHIRLVIERLPSGGLHVWPVLGKADQVHPALEALSNKNDKSVEAMELRSVSSP